MVDTLAFGLLGGFLIIILGLCLFIFDVAVMSAVDTNKISIIGIIGLVIIIWGFVVMGCLAFIATKNESFSFRIIRTTTFKLRKAYFNMNERRRS